MEGLPVSIHLHVMGYNLNFGRPNSSASVAAHVGETEDDSEKYDASSAPVPSLASLVLSNT